MRYIILLVVLVVCTAARCEVHQVSTSNFWQESRVYQFKVDGDVVERPLYLWVTYDPVAPGYVWIDVQAGDAAVVVSSVQLGPDTFTNGASSAVSDDLAPYKFNKDKQLPSGAIDIVVNYSVAGATGVWHVPYIVDYSIQPGWSQIPTNSALYMEPNLYDQVGPIAGYLISASFFCLVIWWTIKWIRESVRTL